MHECHNQGWGINGTEPESYDLRGFTRRILPDYKPFPSPCYDDILIRAMLEAAC
jgi:hypothetical protein